MHKLSRIFLKSSKISSSYEIIHLFTENFIFFRWVFFNRPRSTFLLVRSLLINSLVFASYYAMFSHIKFILIGVDINPVLLFSAATFLGYWSMSQNFNAKCNYLSEMYNDIIKHSADSHDQTTIALKLNFCAQLLTMDLWGHRLYSWIFVDTLYIAAEWSIREEKGLFSSMEEFYELCQQGKLRISEARDLILEYQFDLTPHHYQTKPHLKQVI